MIDKDKELIVLSVGDPSYGPPAESKNAAAYMLVRGRSGYLPPGGLPELREALAQKLSDQNGITATANEINVTVGASLGLYFTMAVICEPNDEVLIPDPCFPLYRSMLQTQRLTPFHYSLHENNSYVPDWGSLESVAKTARALIWNFPSNPLGAVARQEWLKRLYDLLERHPQLYLISDEVYEDLIFHGTHYSPAATAGDLSERIISIFSFSKSYGMTGWRVGYIHAVEPLATEISKSHFGAAMSVPSLAQFAAVAALQAPASYHQEIRNFLTRNRKLALDGLRKWKLRCLEPEAGFFVWVNISDCGLDALTFAAGCEEDCGVLVSPGTNFSPGATDYIRICFAVEAETLAKGIDLLGRWANGSLRYTKVK